MSGPIWTPEEVDILRQMAEKGATPEQVARVLKSRSSNSIRAKAADLGLLIGPRPEVDFEEFQKFLKAQKPVKP